MTFGPFMAWNKSRLPRLSFTRVTHRFHYHIDAQVPVLIETESNNCKIVRARMDRKETLREKFRCLDREISRQFETNFETS